MGKDDKQPIYLIDGSAYIFRAYYATPRLTSSDGFPTNALFGFSRMILKFLRDAAPDHALMVFDAGKITFRNDIYPEYKANRDECPEDLSKQMPYFSDLSRAFGLPVVELPGYEADDVIGTVAHHLEETNHKVVIVSADKDLMQLVTDETTMWDTMRGIRYGKKEVFEKLGVPPEKVIDYLAIAGDSSDNIPGLKGAGPKTASHLVNTYGTVDEIIAARETILEDKSVRSRKKISAQIECDEELVRLSHRLVTVLRDAPLEEATLELPVHDSEALITALERGLPVESELNELVSRFEFQSLINEFGLPGVQIDVPEAPSSEENYTLVLKKDFEKWKKKFLKQSCFAFDLETTSLNIHEAEIVGIAICWDDDEAFYIPFNHYEKPEQQVLLEDFIEATRDHFGNRDIKKVGQNLKYDVSVFLNAGLNVRGVAFDTMLAEYLLHPDRGGYGLSALAKSHLRHTMIEYSDVVPEGGDFREVPLKKALSYGAEDAHITWLLYRKLEDEVKSAELEKVSEEIEYPLVEVLSHLEHLGVELDVDFLNEMSGELGERMVSLEKDIHELAGGEEFNINSPKQLSEVLFNKLGLPTTGIKKTKTGYSTNHAVLEQLSGVHPIADKMVEYRMLAKLKGTYVDALPSAVSPVTGRLHTKLNQTIAATGRLSSSEPNLQNIPIQTELGRKVRRAFTAAPGYRLLSADYSQIELRLLAHLSEDKALIETFQEGVDIHERTAREVLGIPPLMPVEAEDRRLGKTINFGIVYGMSGFRLAKDLGIPIHEGNDYIERYFARYPDVRGYFDELEDIIEQGGEVRTLFGRRRLVTEIDNSGRDQGFVKRAAMNAPLQGSAADLIKLAMVRLQRKIESEDLPLRMILQIHDELLFEVEEDKADEFVGFIKNEMEKIMELRIPLVADVASGANWEEAH